MSDGSLCRALYETDDTTGVQAATALCRRSDLRFHGSKSASQAFVGSMSFILQVSNLSRRRSNSFFRLPHHAKLVRQRSTSTRSHQNFVATKWRAEQIRMMGCNKKAEETKVLPRDRAAHVQHCLDRQQDPR